jgi:hypothetical protein
MVNPPNRKRHLSVLQPARLSEEYEIGIGTTKAARDHCSLGFGRIARYDALREMSNLGDAGDRDLPHRDPWTARRPSRGPRCTPD